MSASTTNLRSQLFSERLQAVLTEKRVSQKELSRRIFIDPSTVNRWFTGGSVPQPRTVEAIANALGVRKEWLLTGKGERAAPPGERARSVVVEETSPNYDMVKKVIFIHETGTPEQLALLSSFLDTVCEKLGLSRKRNRGGDLLILEEEITEDDPRHPGHRPPAGK
jgi:transcriptional regulator with XRE-family HTH domain